MTTFVRRLIAAAAGLLLLAPLAVSADDPVEINAIIPMTGGAAFIGKGYSAAFAALEASVNKHGGINGRHL
jgi:ABC-type branched-subunit amino acid transport system substrate-binding protein